MKQAGQIALMPFPYTNLANSKKRPVLLLRQLGAISDHRLRDLQQRLANWIVG